LYLRDRDPERYRALAVAKGTRVALDVAGQVDREDARLGAADAHLDRPRRAGDVHLRPRHADEAQTNHCRCLRLLDSGFVARAHNQPNAPLCVHRHAVEHPGCFFC